MSVPSISNRTNRIIAKTYGPRRAMAIPPFLNADAFSICLPILHSNRRGLCYKCAGMKREDRENAKQLYKELRSLSWPELWSGEVARFNAASPKEREKRVAVIRAAGVLFAESGPTEDRAK